MPITYTNLCYKSYSQRSRTIKTLIKKNKSYNLLKICAVLIMACLGCIHACVCVCARYNILGRVIDTKHLSLTITTLLLYKNQWWVLDYEILECEHLKLIGPIRWIDHYVWASPEYNGHTGLCSFFFFSLSFCSHSEFNRKFCQHEREYNEQTTATTNNNNVECTKKKLLKTKWW